VDAIVGRTGFGQALLNAGWLVVDGNRLSVPNYTEHLSESAKKRAEDAKRKRLVRKMSEDRPQDVREMSEKNRTEIGLEKRREESKDTASAVSKCSPGNRRFEKPTVADVAAYCGERQNAVDPQAFVDFYESKGWRIGNQPMKNWKAAVRTWERNGNGITGGRAGGNASKGREQERIDRTIGAIAEFAAAHGVHGGGVRQGALLFDGAETNERHDPPAGGSLVRRLGDLPGGGGQRGCD
jgi:hypothetical protein